MNLLPAHRMALRAGGLCEILSLAGIALGLRSGAVGDQDKRGNDQSLDILHVVPAFSAFSTMSPTAPCARANGPFLERRAILDPDLLLAVQRVFYWSAPGM